MENAEASADVVAGAQLHEALASLASTPTRNVVAALHIDGRVTFGGYSQAAVGSVSTAAVRLGCLTKLLTAELALDAAASRQLDLDELAAPRDIARRHAHAGAITVRQLLEHTHGLDDSRLAAAPRASNGCIDEQTLWSALCAQPPLAAPGEIYSYGHAGAWLTAARLERCAHRPYEALLREFLRTQSPELASAANDGAICAASGGSLALSVGGLLALLLRRALATGRSWPTQTSHGTFGALRPLPGWNPLERAVHVGWKAQGAGWFGHASTWPGASALVRVHPQRQVAFLIASADQPAAVVAARVLGRVFPELFDLRISAEPSAASGDVVRLAGRYGSAAWSVTVELAGETLRLRVVDRASGAAATAHASSHGARAGVFFSDPPLPSFPYVQFLRVAGGGVRYLWNGRFILRKVA